MGVVHEINNELSPYDVGKPLVDCKVVGKVWSMGVWRALLTLWRANKGGRVATRRALGRTRPAHCLRGLGARLIWRAPPQHLGARNV